MEPTPTNEVVTENSPTKFSQNVWYRPLCKVTKTSKILAATVMILLPFVGGYVGYRVGSVDEQESVLKPQEKYMAAESSEEHSYQNEFDSFESPTEDWRGGDVYTSAASNTSVNKDAEVCVYGWCTYVVINQDNIIRTIEYPSKIPLDSQESGTSNNPMRLVYDGIISGEGYFLPLKQNSLITHAQLSDDLQYIFYIESTDVATYKLYAIDLEKKHELLIEEYPKSLVTHTTAYYQPLLPNFSDGIFRRRAINGSEEFITKGIGSDGGVLTGCITSYFNNVYVSGDYSRILWSCPGVGIFFSDWKETKLVFPESDKFVPKFVKESEGKIIFANEVEVGETLQAPIYMLNYDGTGIQKTDKTAYFGM